MTTDNGQHGQSSESAEASASSESARESAQQGEGAAASIRLRGEIPDVPRESLWEKLWRPFWMVPAAFVCVAIVAGFAIPNWERGLNQGTLEFVFQGGPDAAREVLGTISASTISVIGLVFSNTLVVLQLISNQFSPRSLSSFLRSRLVQGTLGMFLGTFVFALTTIRVVWSSMDEQDAFVPRLSVTLAFFLALGCLAYFLAFIWFVMNSMKVSNAVSKIGDRTVERARKVFPVTSDDGEPQMGPTWSPTIDSQREVVGAGDHGFIVWVDYRSLASWAREHDAVITVDRRVGESIQIGQPLLRAWWGGEMDDEDVTQLQRCVEIRADREMYQDVAFGLRQLTDIADTSLAPSSNDPTTCMQVIHEFHRVFRYLVGCTEPSPYIADEDGQVRVVHEPQRIGWMLTSVVAEVAHYADATPQALHALLEMIDDLETVAKDKYSYALDECRSTITEALGGEERAKERAF